MDVVRVRGPGRVRDRPHSREYLTVEEALPLGFRVSEVDAAGSVPELLVANPLDANVLLYDGEELLDGKQNRIPYADAPFWWGSQPQPAASGPRCTIVHGELRSASLKR